MSTIPKTQDRYVQYLTKIVYNLFGYLIVIILVDLCLCLTDCRTRFKHKNILKKKFTFVCLFFVFFFCSFTRFSTVAQPLCQNNNYRSLPFERVIVAKTYVFTSLRTHDTTDPLLRLLIIIKISLKVKANQPQIIVYTTSTEILKYRIFFFFFLLVFNFYVRSSRVTITYMSFTGFDTNNCYVLKTINLL